MKRILLEDVTVILIFALLLYFAVVILCFHFKIMFNNNTAVEADCFTRLSNLIHMHT